MLLEQCCGHPLSMHLFGIVANTDCSLAPAMGISSVDIQSCVGRVEHLFTTTFNCLLEEQKRVLLAVGLFGGDAKLSSVCNVGAL